MTKIKFLTAIVVLVSFINFSGCEITKLPIVLDSSLSETITVNITSPVSQYSDSVNIMFNNLRKVTGERIDSLKFYNLTLTIEDLAPSNASISGNITVDGVQLLTFNNLNLSQFASEKSIFDKKLNGLQYHYNGVGHLMHILKTQTSQNVVIKFSMENINQAIQFKLKIKLYAQVFSASD